MGEQEQAGHGRELLLGIYAAAIRAADPEAAVLRAMAVMGSRLTLRDLDGRAQRFEIPSAGVRIAAMGKAAAAMAIGAVHVLGEWVHGGVVVAPPGESGGARGRVAAAGMEWIESSHPLPDEASVRGGEKLLEAARAASRAGELFLVLLSGGASALAEAPLEGISLDEIRETTRQLLASGAPIEEVNRARKRLSRIKGGGLARAAGAATVVTLALSDVIGAPLDAIGGGPTLGADLPSERFVVIGSAMLAAEAARKECEARGIAAEVIDAQLRGEVEEFARALPARVARVLAGDAPRAPCCLIWAGELTIHVRGPGRGGRNQQLALAAALQFEGAHGVTFAALATDGIDGPTDAAGAIVDGCTAGKIRAAGIDPACALEENDALAALEAGAALVRTGPSGTNVNDLFLLYVEA